MYDEFYELFHLVLSAMLRGIVHNAAGLWTKDPILKMPICQKRKVDHYFQSTEGEHGGWIQSDLAAKELNARFPRKSPEI